MCAAVYSPRMAALYSVPHRSSSSARLINTAPATACYINGGAINMGFHAGRGKHVRIGSMQHGA